MTKKKGLGRGLGALIEMDEQEASANLCEISLSALAPNPFQPRAEINPDELKELAESIKENGVLEPLLVRRSGANAYQLIAGERRFRAATLAGLATVPVLIKDVDDQKMLELALVENLHRQDLNPIEEAEAYRRLADEFGHSQQDIARVVSRDRSTVANLMRLLKLPTSVKTDVTQGRLTTGHARALLSLEKQELIEKAREEILRGKLTVRQTETLVRRLLAPREKPAPDPADKAYFDSLAHQVTSALGLKARLNRRGRKGSLVIRFASDEELAHLLERLGARLG